MKSFLIWVGLLGIAIPVSAGTSKYESTEILNKSRDLQQSDKEVFHKYMYPDDLPHVPINKILSSSYPLNVKLAIQNHLIVQGYQFCLSKKMGVDDELTHQDVISHGFSLIELLADDDQASGYF